MGNKTIYVSDEKLWSEAKKLAGQKGLSAVIAEALRQFVTESRLVRDGYQDWRFAAGPGGADRIAFNGKLLVEKRSNASRGQDVWPPEAFPDDADEIQVQIEVYRTRKGTFVVVGELVRTDNESIPVYWATQPSVSAVRADKAVSTMESRDRADLLDEVSVEGQDDWATFIE